MIIIVAGHTDHRGRHVAAPTAVDRVVPTVEESVTDGGLNRSEARLYPTDTRPWRAAVRSCTRSTSSGR